jgi:hypothetical protein
MPSFVRETYIYSYREKIKRNNYFYYSFYIFIKKKSYYKKVAIC